MRLQHPNVNGSVPLEQRFEQRSRCMQRVAIVDQDAVAHVLGHRPRPAAFPVVGKAVCGHGTDFRWVDGMGL
jgi:hypothetical protein